MSARVRKLLLIIAFIFRTMFVHTSQIASTWTRDRKLDDVIKVSVLLHQEVAGRTAVHCASRCSLYLSCFSFFFLPSAGKCLLNEFVLTTPDGGQPSPGAMYFRRKSVDCPVSDEFVQLQANHLCIKVYQSSATFHYAYAECTRVGARLVVLDTGDKFKAVTTYMKDKYNWLSEFFMGAMREGALNGTRTTWDTPLHPLYWLNGDKVDTSGSDTWTPGNPDNFNAAEGCLQYNNGKFNDLSCDSTNPFICEKV